MWISSKPLNANICPRPVRIAYLIPQVPSHLLLDVLIEESLSRWGGRRTPLIPTNGEYIAPAYWAFLNLWDADIIYSYVELSEEIEKRIFSMFAPSEIRIHDGLMKDQDAFKLRPEFTNNFKFLSSLSLLPFIARRSQLRGTALPEVLDKEPRAKTERDLDDSFGFVSNSNCDSHLLPHARRLSLRASPTHRIAQRFSEPAEVSYIDDAEQFVETIAKNWGLLTLSRLSDMLCPHLHHLAQGREGWDNHLTIIIGDEIADRLLFWNAQHRYKADNSLNDLPVLRLSPKRFESGPPEWLKNWVAVRNHRHLDGNQAPQTVLRSCSLSKEKLDEIAIKLKDNRIVMISSIHHTDPCIIDDCKNWVSENRTGAYAQFPSIWTHPIENKRATIRFQNNEFELPLTQPLHIRDVPSPSLSNGVWSVDLCFERAEDHSQFSNRQHVWKWPRRLRLEQAIRFENYASSGSFPVIPPPVRPTEKGDLTVWDCATWSRPILYLPTDYQSFTNALAYYVPGSLEEKKALEMDLPRERFNKIAVSDKGRDLLGVFQFFQSLPEALAFLTNEFWCYVIHQLSPEEPANNEKNIKELTSKLQEIIRQGAQETHDVERFAKRALSLASRLFSSQREQLKAKPFDTLLTWATKVTERKQGEIKECLAESVTYLRDRDFLWQGFRWKCSFCQHHNWVPLKQLSPIAKCEICRKPESSPVSGSLHFRLNPFVQHAFSSTSAQEPVIWCLNHLARRAMWSFAFAPTLDVYRAGRSNPETDLDIVAVVDGQVYFVEVKSSFAGVTVKDQEQLKFLVYELRPDVVMLGVMANNADAEKYADIIEAFGSGITTYGVRFELLTLDGAHRDSSHGEIALPTSKQMNWSAW